eukprot:TRINITY_DN67951_c2_g1_i1.p1 TRINITY_DN67951_c2_g1~~TRINITY_DN67951_c2_g1_i1.p1  ORF type:complete len:1110 (+),score=163.35 TRINITY_DN67951_c2_g1_i1:314-3331(+)
MNGYAQTALQNASRLDPEDNDTAVAISTMHQTLAERHRQQQSLSDQPLSLCQCVYGGDINAVRACLDSGAQAAPEFVTLPHCEMYMTPMQIALLNQYFDAAKLLLERGILFTDNVCDWMVAQILEEKKRATQHEKELKDARADLEDLRQQIASGAALRQKLSDALNKTNQQLNECQADVEAQQQKVVEAERQRDQAKNDAAQMKLQRDDALQQLDAIRGKLSEFTGSSEEIRLQSTAWKPQLHVNQQKVQLVAVPATVAPDAADSQVTQSLRTHHAALATFQNFVSNAMQFRKVDTQSRANTRQLLAVTEEVAEWVDEMEPDLAQWCNLKVDVSKFTGPHQLDMFDSIKMQLSGWKKEFENTVIDTLLTEMCDIIDSIKLLLKNNKLPGTKVATILQLIANDFEATLATPPLPAYRADIDTLIKITESAVSHSKFGQFDNLGPEKNDEAADLELNRQLENYRSLLGALGAKIDALAHGNDETTRKLDSVKSQSVSKTNELRQDYEKLRDECSDDITALKEKLNNPEKDGALTTAKDAQSSKAFSSFLADNDNQQDELWSSLKNMLSDLAELQEARLDLVKGRIEAILDTKRRKKLDVQNRSAAGSHLMVLTRIHSGCGTGLDGLDLVASYCTTYKRRFKEYLRSTYDNLSTQALFLHREFYQWFTLMYSEQAKALSHKRHRYQALKRETKEAQNQQAAAYRRGETSQKYSERLVELDERRKQLEETIPKMESEMAAALLDFDGPGRTAEYFNAHGITFTHPTAFNTLDDELKEDDNKQRGGGLMAYPPQPNSPLSGQHHGGFPPTTTTTQQIPYQLPAGAHLAHQQQFRINNISSHHAANEKAYAAKLRPVVNGPQNQLMVAPPTNSQAQGTGASGTNNVVFLVGNHHHSSTNSAASAQPAPTTTNTSALPNFVGLQNTPGSGGGGFSLPGHPSFSTSAVLPQNAHLQQLVGNGRLLDGNAPAFQQTMGSNPQATFFSSTGPTRLQPGPGFAPGAGNLAGTFGQW